MLYIANKINCFVYFQQRRKCVWFREVNKKYQITQISQLLGGLKVIKKKLHLIVMLCGEESSEIAIVYSGAGVPKAALI